MTISGGRHLSTTSFDQIAIDKDIPGGIDVLGISTSMKPGPGVEGVRSATTNILRIVLNMASRNGLKAAMLDLRDVPIPLFDGRSIDQRPEKSCSVVMEALESSTVLCCTVPAYWSGYSGVFKNFVDVVGGAHYDDENPVTLLSGKRLGLIVVGADQVSADMAAGQAETTLAHIGAELIAKPISLTNPRRIPWDEAKVLKSFADLVSCFKQRG